MSSDEEIIDYVRGYIKMQTGLTLTCDDYFTGIKKHAGRTFFCVELEAPEWLSQDFVKLRRLAHPSKLDRDWETIVARQR